METGGTDKMKAPGRWGVSKRRCKECKMRNAKCKMQNDFAAGRGVEFGVPPFFISHFALPTKERDLSQPQAAVLLSRRHI